MATKKKQKKTKKNAKRCFKTTKKHSAKKRFFTSLLMATTRLTSISTVTSVTNQPGLLVSKYQVRINDSL